MNPAYLKTRFGVRICGLLVAAAGCFYTPAWASIDLFEIDSVRSALGLEASTSGVPWDEQSAGSLRATFHGWLAIDNGDNTVQFIAGSSLIADETEAWQPGVRGSATTSPASYGGVNVVGTGLNSVRNLTATRSLAFDISGAPLPMTETGFDVSGLVFTIPNSDNASLDHRSSGLLVTAARRALGGLTATNAPAEGHFSFAAEVQTLSVPVDITFKVQTTSPGDTTLHFTGTVVGHRGLSLRRPVLLMVRGSKDPGEVTLVWGDTYNLETSETLNPPAWVPYEGPGPLVLTNSAAQGYFRLGF